MSGTRSPAAYNDHLIPLQNAQQFLGLFNQSWAGLNLNGNDLLDSAGSDITDATLIQVVAAWINSGDANSGVKIHPNQGVGIIANDGDTAFKVYPPDATTQFNDLGVGAATDLTEGDVILYFRVTSSRYIAVTLTKST